MKSKTWATWLALLTGSVGLHRFYLRGWSDPWGWLHLPLTALGLIGIDRLQQFGQDDRVAWALLPCLGVSLSGSMFCAILYGLTPDERWDRRHNPAGPASSSGWGAVIGVVLALLLGATALISTIAFGVQRLVELQIESTHGGAPRP